MDSDNDTDNNVTEISVSSLEPDSLVNRKTLENDMNENKTSCLQDIATSPNVLSSIEHLHDNQEIINNQLSQQGDNKLLGQPVNDLDISNYSHDQINYIPQEPNSTGKGKVLDCIENPFVEDVNTNDASEALNYFSKYDEGAIDVDSSSGVTSEESVDIPNGIINKTSTAELKPSHSSKVFPLDKRKYKKIMLALKNNDTDTLRLAALSEGGLLTDEIRKKVWPKLVGVDIYETSGRPSQKEIEAHPYYGQVVLDVNRSLQRFPPSIHEAQRLMMLDQLVFLIMRVLCCHPEMHYYQGYHDICVTFLLVLGEEMAYHVIEKLSRTHLKTYMEKNMEPTIHLLEHMYVLIGKRHPILKEFLLKSEVGVAYCLSWLITWFSHVLNDYDSVVRLFDFFIVSHPYMPMYVTSAVVLHQESDVLKQGCDMASVHSFLADISDDLPFEELLLESLSLFKDYSPEMLASEHPYVPRSLKKPNKRSGLFQRISKTIKRVVPSSNVAIPIVVAAAVLVTAVLYQTYKY